MNRYIPFTQQRYCCVPTCLQMVMYRHGIPLLPAEELAYALGLTVPEEDLWLFDKARSGERPLSGWGTRIQESEFEINKVLASVEIPLSVEVDTDISSSDSLKSKLTSIGDGDAFICFDYGKLWDEDVTGGHVCVFDRLEGDTVWMIDPERNVPKHRKTTVLKLYEAMKFHGAKNSAGLWSINKIR